MCTVFITLVQCFRVARAGNVPNLPVFVLVLVPLVQCFTWSARAMYPFARVRTRTGTPCTVLRLVSPGNVPICSCSYSYWYPLYSASLGQHGQCAYLPVFVLVLCVNRCTVYSACAPCTVFPWASAGNVPIFPCSYSYWYPSVPLVHASTGNAPTYPCLCSYCTCTVAQYVLYCTSCTMNRRARVRIRTVVVPLHSVPCLYLL